MLSLHKAISSALLPHAKAASSSHCKPAIRGSHITTISDNSRALGVDSSAGSSKNDSTCCTANTSQPGIVLAYQEHELQQAFRKMRALQMQLRQLRQQMQEATQVKATLEAATLSASNVAAVAAVSDLITAAVPMGAGSSQAAIMAVLMQQKVAELHRGVLSVHQELLEAMSCCSALLAVSQ